MLRKGSLPAKAGNANSVQMDILGECSSTTALIVVPRFTLFHQSQSPARYYSDIDASSHLPDSTLILHHLWSRAQARQGLLFFSALSQPTSRRISPPTSAKTSFGQPSSWICPASVLPSFARNLGIPILLRSPPTPFPPPLLPFSHFLPPSLRPFRLRLGPARPTDRETLPPPCQAPPPKPYQVPSATANPPSPQFHPSSVCPACRRCWMSLDSASSNAQTLVWLPGRGRL